MIHRVTATGEQTSLADRKRRAGQRIMIGFSKPWVDDDLRHLVREIQPSGFILFSRNVEEPAQVRELCRELGSLVDPAYPALIAIDQEGGRVQRIREPATVWPSMRQVAQADADATAIGLAMGQELRAMGLHLNFAPVADVDSNPDNPVIGDRSFGRDPAEVGRYVVDLATGLHQAGVIACPKHFPGHGDTTVDSHVGLPVVEEEVPRLMSRELLPFRAAVEAGVGALMSAHVVFPAFDEDLPATLSPRVMPRLLRRELGFDGVVFSDDMEMKAIAARWEVPQIAELSTRATVDVLLCCHEPAFQVEMYQTLVRLQEDDASMDQLATTSCKRLLRLRERFLLDAPRQPGLEILGCPEHHAMSAMVRIRGS